MTTKTEARSDAALAAGIPERLEAILHDELGRFRGPVSKLVRGVLDDTVRLVDTAVTESFRLTDHVVGDSLKLARTARRGATEIAKTALEAYGGLSAEDDGDSKRV